MDDVSWPKLLPLLMFSSSGEKKEAVPGLLCEPRVIWLFVARAPLLPLKKGWFESFGLAVVCFETSLWKRKKKKKKISNPFFSHSLTTPQYAIHHNVAVKSVLIPAHTGAMVVLSKHIPTIAQLKPGVVAVTKVLKLCGGGGGRV